MRKKRPKRQEQYNRALYTPYSFRPTLPCTRGARKKERAHTLLLDRKTAQCNGQNRTMQPSHHTIQSSNFTILDGRISKKLNLKHEKKVKNEEKLKKHAAAGQTDK